MSRVVGWSRSRARALVGSNGPCLIDIGERARASPTSPDSWSVFSDRSDKPIDVDGEFILRDHSVRIDANESRCATGAVVFHRCGIDTERRAALMAEGNPEAVALQVEGRLVARIDVGALECGLDCGDPDILGAGIWNQRLESWKSVRVLATAPMLVKREACAARRAPSEGEAGVPFPRHRSNRGPRVREQAVRCSQSWFIRRF